MIYATVNMTIGDYSSTCDNKILLYRGDKNVEIRIVMKGNKFTVLDSTYAQMIIRRPSATSVFSEPAPIQNDTVVFVITEDMIDELKEIGEYTFQVRLYDDTMTARATLPPCNSALIIERPIAVEGEAAVNLAIVNDSAVMPAADVDEEEIFTEDNKYNKTIWVDGDLITDARLNKIEDALYYINENGGNGSGGGATAPYISTELPETVMVGSDENFDLNLYFNSPNMGKGTLRVFINDADSMSIKIDQGDSCTVVPSSLFAKGTNRVVVYVLDRVGVMSNSLVFYIRYGSTEISSDFDPYSAYDYGATIRYYFTPTALDTSLSLTFYMSIDGQVQQGVNCSSDTRGYYTFPTNLSADSHYCEAYVVDSKGVKSNVLSFNLIILDADTLVVASDTKEVSVEEGEQVSLDYKVYMKYNTSFIANIYVDNELVNTGTCNADFNYYKTSSLTKGVHTVKLEVFDVTETHSDYITWTVAVSDSTYEMLQPVNAGAMFIGTAVNKTNTDERKQYFIGHDQEGNEVLGTLSNFAYNSESGWVNDELIISGNSHVEIPVQPLANNAKYGFTLDIEFTSKQIGVPDAEVLTLWNNETNCGVKITTEKLILRSSNGNQCDLYFTDNEKTHVMFVIDRQELKAKIYLNGVMCEAFHLNDYTVEGVAYLDDFTVNSNIILGGLNKNGYCKIRNLRVYQVALTTDEIINNFISCEIDKAKQRELSEFQKGNDLPTLYVYCDFSGLGKDDKKPCKIVYNSTNEALYGKSFNLDHKQSQLQYQGTSSMAYPIKNYRLNLRDENGDKWYYTLPTAQPECRFTLKADFMSSGHWTNTGMAKFINDKLYNYNVNDAKTMNPFKWDHVQNGGKVNDFRETITGFPCRLILVNDGETPLNTGQNEPTPGNTKDMGIFNFNNDKDNVTTLGFNSDIFPNCASYEVTANSDTSAGAFMRYFNELPISCYYATTPNIWINPYIDLKLLKLSVGETIYVECNRRIGNIYFNKYKDTGDGVGVATTGFTPNATSANITIPDSAGFIRFRFNDVSDTDKPTYIKINSRVYSVKFEELEKVQEFYMYNPADELAYLKESFELRHPDEDDVAEDWGFMGVETTGKCVDYWIASDKMTTTTFTYSDTSIEVTGADVSYISCYGENGYIASALGSNGIYTIRDGTTMINITFTTSNIEKFYINGVMYTPGTTANMNTMRDPYDSTVFDMSYGLKALIDWVDNCTDEEFVRDFEQHFHKDYTLRYFCLVTLIGAVDNLGKNMMLDTADNKIFFPRFYDIDTICSYDNSGQLKFDVDIEMEQGYWNTSSSRLWTRIRDLMHADIVTTYNNMRQNGVSYENMMHYIYDEQIAKIPQAYYNKDYDVKYAPFADSYIGMAHGDTYEHVKRWLKQRFIFVDSLFDYAPSYNNDVLTIRANTTELMTLEIETYTPVYQHLSWYNGQMDKKKIDGKVSVEFSGTAQAATDQEVLIYGGSNVKSIKGITSMNPNRMLIGSATKLVEIDAHDCPLLADINANKANLSPHEYLNKVDLSNCPLLEGNLRLNNSPLVQEINIKGTKITGMNLPSSIRNLQILRLPNTMTELTLNDAGMLHTLEFDEGVKMQSVAMSNCNALTNVVNLDLLNTPSVSLDNSYNSAAELYFRDTNNLTLKNMSNLERVIFTPNNEYETFELINVANAPDYKVTTFNCPKLSTFMTTAPYRESYNNCGMTTKSESTGTLVYKDFSPNGTTFSKVIPFDYYNDVIEAEIDLTNCDTALLNENILSFATTEGTLSVWGQTTAIHIYYTASTKTLKFSYNGNSYNIDKILTNTTVNIKMDKGTIYLNNETVLEGSIIESIFSPITTIAIGSKEGSTRSYALYKSVRVNYDEIDIPVKDYGDIQPNTTFTANSIDISSTQFTDVKLLCTTDTNTLKLPTTVKNFYCDSSFDLDTDYLEDGEYDVVHGELVEPYTTDYEGEVVRNKYNTVLVSKTTLENIPVSGGTILAFTASGTLAEQIYEYDSNGNLLVLTNTHTIKTKDDSTGLYKGSIILNDSTSYINITAANTSEFKATLTELYTPNLIPSSADGSLIFSMYAPSNAVAPASGTWDLHGLEFDNFHTFGMNNDVKAMSIYQMRPHIHPNINLAIHKPIPLDSVDKLMAEVRTDDGSATKGVYLYGFSDPEYRVWTGVHGNFMYGPIDMKAEALKIDPTTKYLSIHHLGEEEGKYLYINGDKYLLPTVRESADTSNTIWRDLVGYTSITMPARYDDYNITIKNAYIAPKTHNTMLYPLLVNEDNPITGTLDYTNYAGKHLSWSFAYTDEEYVNIIQPKNELLNSYEYRYNAFHETEYEFDNPYEIARYTSSASGVLPEFNTEFTYTYDEIDNGDGTYTTKIYADDLDILPTRISFYNISTLISVERLNTSNVTNMINMFHGCSSLTSLDLSSFGTSNVTSMSNMFKNCSKLTSLDVSGFDTSNVTDMSGMFGACSGLTTLDLSRFDTSNVNNMSSMFSACTSLTTLDLSGFDTSNVINMANMFQNCNKLTSLNVSGFDTSKVTSMGYMFHGCIPLTTLDLSSFDTSKVTSMNYMFQNCNKLTSLDLSGFDTAEVTTMANMFYACSSLTSLDVSGFDTAKVTNMGNMFMSCRSLTSLDVSGFKTSKVTIMNDMFRGCSGLTSLDVSGFDTSTVTNMNGMFAGCSGLTSLDVSGFDISKVTGMSDTFSGCTGLLSLNLSNWSSDKINTITITTQLSASPSTSTLYGTVMIDETLLPSGWVYDNVLIIAKYTANATGVLPTFNSEFTYTYDEIDNGDGTYTTKVYTDSLDNSPTSISFYNIITVISVERLNTSNVTNMGSMFQNCSKLTSLDLSGFDTSNATNMGDMFRNCSGLTSLDVSGFDTAKVTNMGNMFASCTKLTSLDVSGFDTAKVTNMNSMFRDCSSLTELDVSGFDMSNVTGISNMFNSCSKLTSLSGIESWNVGKVTAMDQFMHGCTNLAIELDLSNWNISNCVLFASAFRNTGLTGINLTNWSPAAAYTNMANMFRDSRSMTKLIAPNLVNANVNGSLSYFLNNCSSLASLDVSQWDVSGVKDLGYIFQGCSSLTSLDLTHWDVSGATTLAGFLNSCSALTDLKTNFVLNKASLNSFLYGCGSLKDLSNMRLSGTVTTINGFAFGVGATSLDLSTLDCTYQTEGMDIYTLLNSNITEFYPPTNISQNIIFSYINTISIDSIVRIFNNLITTTETRTITLQSSVLNKLTEEQIAIATNKGWTVTTA